MSHVGLKGVADLCRIALCCADFAAFEAASNFSARNGWIQRRPPHGLCAL